MQDKNLLPTSRAMRMAASADGRRVAFGWLGFAQERTRPPHAPRCGECLASEPEPKALVCAAHRWHAADVARSGSGLCRSGEEISVWTPMRWYRQACRGSGAEPRRLEGRGRGIRGLGLGASEPAIGKWDPPIRVLNFFPDSVDDCECSTAPARSCSVIRCRREKESSKSVLAAVDQVWCWPAPGSRAAWRAPRGCRWMAAPRRQQILGADILRQEFDVLRPPAMA